MHEMNIGQLVLSKAGRDKGNYFLVMEMSGEYLYLADGKHRRMDQLKKKEKKACSTYTLDEPNGSGRHSVL